ncbi:hemerythrin family protein [Methanospirillum sp. J.3.6.1-F.2.7.3]|uniref:Hemerythrin family protein n=2 Tax=Methanospirillum TaxID=2202 RepID=A0A8E7AXW7_9EURY|nr:MULTISPECIES: bacteriohemerythrin [Methanospirillum]MDX8550126.1 bacteriohemerythrin [Methanospirillum hungatei]NLW75549.1 hemerythrin family protein [Methanomicrobiales archaeon]QVV87488.1 hemerythrin family protein [Methanospirillum sp. J.3.6.1-F.2.7.3]QXO94953.1 bacteriohemerythrin [Methanospirillum hungatei]
MVLMKWSDDLSVQVTEIDNQHKKLIDIINSLHEAMLEKKSKEMLAGILDELAAYTVYHFSTEEKYMTEFNYIGLLSHKKEHDAFVSKIESFISAYQSNKLGLSMELMSFLRDWVSNHIKGTDKKYSGVFNKNGLI